MLKKLGLAMLLVAGNLLAQTPDRLVESVVITYGAGAPALAEQAVRSHIELKENAPYSQGALDRSIKGLFATGFFEDIKATPETLPNGRVSVTFKLTAKLKARTISFEGNREFKTKKLQKQVELKANERVDEQTLAKNADLVKKYYETRGFPNTKVVTRTVRFENAGLVDVTFVVSEGPKTQIERIRFEGNKNVSEKQLLKRLKTKEKSYLSFLTGSGRVQEENLATDVESLTEYYRNLGYLEVFVEEPKTTPYKDGVELVYTIEEGDLYRAGSVSVAGNTIFDTEKLSQALQIQPGQPLSAAQVDASASALRDIYGAEGYLDTAVRPQMSPGKQPLTLDVVFNISESAKIKVGSINVEGNTITKNIVVAREINLAPADTFSSTKMKVSEKRLKNTGYFETVNLTDEPTSDSEVHDLRVAVTEGQTGNFMFGAGVSSLDKATIFGEFSQGNFDILNYRNFFRGDGQKFRLYVSLGEESSEATLNWEEPWLFDRRLAGGINLYRNENSYVSSVYDERRAGFELYTRKRLFELVDGRLGFTRETVDIFDITDEASPLIVAEGGERTVSKLRLSLTRDTRDQVIYPTRGNRLELNTEYAGGFLGEETDYWKIEARAAQYFTVTKKWVPQYLTLLGRVGTMDSFDGNTVPLFDKFFLGGPNSIRGFSYRKAGPLDATGEPIGGKTYGFGSAEYAFQLFDPIQLAAFYDWGFVNRETGDFSASDYNDSWGVGVRVLVMGAPMRLDLAFPISAEDKSDNDGRFWFSFGTRF